MSQCKVVVPYAAGFVIEFEAKWGNRDIHCYGRKQLPGIVGMLIHQNCSKQLYRRIQCLDNPTKIAFVKFVVQECRMTTFQSSWWAEYIDRRCICAKFYPRETLYLFLRREKSIHWTPEMTDLIIDERPVLRRFSKFSSIWWSLYDAHSEKELDFGALKQTGRRTKTSWLVMLFNRAMLWDKFPQKSWRTQSSAVPSNRGKVK